MDTLALVEKIEPHRPWASLELQVPNQVHTFFPLAMITEVGNGVRTLFWTDRWLSGQRLADLAASLFAAIPRRKRQQHMVETTLQNHAWVSYIQGALTIDIIVDYIQLWELINELQRLYEVEDAHKWRLDSAGQYSSKSAYNNLFLGAMLFVSCERIWKSWAPPKCNMLMWLVAHKRCWTTDRLARRVLDHLKNARCATKKMRPLITY
jgi:hypothetical protein